MSVRGAVTEALSEAMRQRLAAEVPGVAGLDVPSLDFDAYPDYRCTAVAE